VKQYNITTYKLRYPRRLKLADGLAVTSVTDYFVARMRTGYHVELATFFITKLTAATPVILGFPWLQQHNPAIDWNTPSVLFHQPQCSQNCLMAGARHAFAEIAAPAQTRLRRFQASVEEVPDEGEPLNPIPPKNTSRFQATVEEVPDEGEPDAGEKVDRHVKFKTTVECISVGGERQARPLKSATDHRKPQRTAAIPSPPVYRMPKHLKAEVVATISSGAESRALDITNCQPQDLRPALKVAGRRCVGHRESARKTTTKTENFTPKEQLQPDMENMANLKAPNFLTFCRQKGVQVVRVHMMELEQACDQLANLELLDELPLGLLELPDISEESYRRLVEGNYTLEEAYRVFPPQFHEFLKANLTDDHLRRKVDAADVEKFLTPKAKPTVAEILSKLPKEFHDFAKAFQPADADKLPPHRPWDHKIELIPGKQAPYAKNRPFTPIQLRCVKKWLDEMMDKGWIRESRSPAATPLLLAAKPGGGVRICHDYRGLNNVTVKNRYPIPLIKETLDALCRAKWYTKVDIVAAFNRIRIAEGHEWMTAFITRFGLYEMLVMPFGLCNAPATFQNYINHALHDVLDVYATAYLDDILIYSDNRGDHTRHVKDVLQRLIDFGLTADINKSDFFTKKTKYLGLIISTEGIQMDPTKIKTIVDWKDPSRLKELQQFLGFANFYRRFIQGFSTITMPLTRLMRKEVAWSWGADQKKAFAALKKAFTTAPILAYYDYNRRTIVETDASDWAAGGVLLQYDDQNKLRPVAFFSAKHSAAECNYEIYDKELLAIVKALEEWQPELEGNSRDFEVKTDHKNLQYFMTTKDLNQRQMRWAEFLSRFNFRITYQPGKKALLPDALSRLPGSQPLGENDERLAHRRRALLPPEKFNPIVLDQLMEEARESGDWEHLAPVAAELETLDSKSLDDLVSVAYERNEIARRMVSALRDPTCRRWPKDIAREIRIDFADCSLVEGRIFFRQKLFIPPDPEVRLQIIWRTHSSGPAGHPGRLKTEDLLRRTYWWPRMSKDVAKFVRACQLCFRTKTPRSAPPGFLKPLDIPFRAWSHISIDYVIDLPACERDGRTFKHLLTIVDRLTKMRHFIPVTGLSVEELVDCFVTRVYVLHGAPDDVVSDRGSQFVSAFWRRLSERLNTKLSPSSAYHPETDGQSEIVNAQISRYLRAFTNFSQDDWVDWLPFAEFAQNNLVNETTGVSPFFANYGYNPRLGIEPQKPAPPTLSSHELKEYMRADTLADRFERILSHLQALSRQSQARYEENVAQSRDQSDSFKPGDLVMVDTKNLKTNRPKKKWDDKWFGPVKVLTAYPRAVVVKLPDDVRINNSFHTSKVRRWSDRDGLPGQEQINEQERRNVRGRILERDDDGTVHEAWEFETILDCHNEDGFNYLVKWKHCKPTWVDEKDLAGNDDYLKDWHQNHPNKPCPTRLSTENSAAQAPRRSGRLKQKTSVRK